MVPHRTLLVHYAGFLLGNSTKSLNFLIPLAMTLSERLRVLQEKVTAACHLFHHRYFKRTIDLASYWNRRSVPVIGLTLTALKSPLLPYSSIVLFVPIRLLFTHIVPSMSVINVLIVCYARTVNQFNKKIFSEKTWKNY